MSDNSIGSPRALLLAYLCSPHHGSEPSVGWHQVMAMVGEFDLTVICLDRQEYREAVEQWLMQNTVTGLRFVFVSKSSLEERMSPLPGMYYLAYRRWHRRAYGVAKVLHAEKPFDVVHQVNLCTFREPGDLWRLDAPFIWGPIGGTQNYPWRFLQQAGLRGMASEALRNVLNRIQLYFSRRVRKAASKASRFIAANTTVQRDLAERLGRTPLLMLETGIESVESGPRHWSATGRPFRILWSGNLVPLKGPRLFLDALRWIGDDCDYEVVILGKGPLDARLRRQAKELGISERISFRGHLPLREALEQYKWADLFVFTSLRDTSGNVVLEALSHGVPVVCLDHQGVADIVTETSGVKIPVTTPTGVAAEIAEVICRLSKSPQVWERLSAGALARARDYLWSRKARKMKMLYRQVIAEHRQAASRR